MTTPSLLELALRRTQGVLAEELGLTDDGNLEAGPTFAFPGLPFHTMCLPDLMLDKDRRWRATEVNVSNAAGTSAHEADLPRVTHEISTMIGRNRPLNRNSVVLRPYSPDTRSTPEIRIRTAIAAAMIEQTTGIATSAVSARTPKLPDGRLAVVTGDIKTMTDHLELRNRQLLFRGRPVVFLNNPNLFAELGRRLGVPLNSLLGELDPEVLHEGTGMAAIGFDKVLQQEIAVGSELTPIAGHRCSTASEAIYTAREMAALYGGSIIKPDAASGGTGVVPVDAKATFSEIAAEVAAAQSKLASKYGPGWEETCRLAVYEFAHALPARTPTGAKRWDLRLEVLVTPNKTQITPLSARLCPAPIGPKLSRADSVCNQTDRAKGEAEGITPHELCERLGVQQEVLGHAAAAAYSWVQNAMTHLNQKNGMNAA